VTRYVGKYGTDRVRKAVLIGTLGPYLVKAADNVEGVDSSVFEGIKNAIRADRASFTFDFLKNFYNYGRDRRHAREATASWRTTGTWRLVPHRPARCSASMPG